MDIYSPNYTTGTFGRMVKGLVEPSGSISFSTQTTDKPFEQVLYSAPHDLLANPRTFLSPPDLEFLINRAIITIISRLLLTQGEVFANPLKPNRKIRALCSALLRWKLQEKERLKKVKCFSLIAPISTQYVSRASKP